MHSIGAPDPQENTPARWRELERVVELCKSESSTPRFCWDINGASLFEEAGQMFRRMVVVLGLVAMGATSLAAGSSPPMAKPQGLSPSRSGHLPVNGLKLYYEVYGELGKSKTAPLLLIPGAFLSTDSMTPWVAAFAARRSV